MQGTIWSVLKSLTGNMTYKVKIHGRETKEFTQKKGYGQGPGSSPTKFNTSMEPLLIALQEAGAGIMIDGRNVIGFAWSDDMFTIVLEDKLDQVLECIRTSSTTYKKKLKASKSFAMPMCRKKNGVKDPPSNLMVSQSPPHKQK